MGIPERSLRQQSCQYEYPSPIKIESDAGIYFTIPSSIIFNKGIGDKRITAFSFFIIRRGLDCRLTFSINSIVEWTKRKPDRHSSGINKKFANTIEKLNEEGYITLSGKLGNSSCTEAYFNLEKVSKECEYDRFAIIYLDEIKKIFNYKNPNSKDAFLNSDVILLVFAYLRMMITRRRNKLRPEEVNLDNNNDHNHDIEVRKQRYPDAYDCYYYEIADALGISQRSVSKIIEVLKELKLIYYEQLPRIKRDDKWLTNQTIFCNYYKREKNYLLISGEEYYLQEIQSKKKKLDTIKKQEKI